jgi:nucleoid DNA-binding protein
MRKGALLGVGSLTGVLALLFALTAPAQPPAPPPAAVPPPGLPLTKPPEETLNQRLARVANLTEEDIAKVMAELGPAIQYEITHGRQVSFAGLGTIRVVRVPEHRNINSNGQPVTIPAVNTVEFLANEQLKAAANQSGAVPAETVPEYRFNPLPQQAPSQRVPNIRNPGTRTKS